MLDNATLIEMRPGEMVTIGPFKIKPIHVTHSLVDCVSLAIHTPLGVIIHTGDFKVDPTPTDNKLFDLHTFAEYGKEGVLALFQDSTNVERTGYTPSERAVGRKFDEVTEEIIAAGARMGDLDLLPSPFPIEDLLNERELRHVKRLYGIGGLSYGNLSQRKDARRFWMSASGVDKAHLETPGRDILLVSNYDQKNGRIVLSVPPAVEPRRVSVDAIEHWMIYQAHPGVGAILHVHAWMEGIDSTEINSPCGTVELAGAVARDVADRESHCEDSEAKGQGDAQKPNAQIGESGGQHRTAATGKCQPKRTDRFGGLDDPLEIWDGAHNLDGVGWLLPRLPDRRYVVVASILRDKNADGMLAALSALGDTVVTTASAQPRALSADELATLARRWFERTETEEDPGAALARARSIAGPEGAVLVTGSLYLLADLAAMRTLLA